MPQFSRTRLLAALPAILGLLAGCVTPAPAPRATLDARTGVTLTVVDEPLVLARERRDIAAQARDYLTLVAAEIDEAGHRRLVLAAHQWSTIDSRAADTRPANGAELLLVADGRDFHFVPVPATISAGYANNPALKAPPDAEVVTTLYETNVETLAYVAGSHDITASFPNSFALPFSLWKDGRDSMKRLLAQIGNQK